MMKKHENGTDLFVQDQGQGAPVILLHGFPLDHRMWESRVSFVSDAPDATDWTNVSNYPFNFNSLKMLKNKTYLQNTKLSNIIPHSCFTKLQAFFMQQSKSDIQCNQEAENFACSLAIT